VEPVYENGKLYNLSPEEIAHDRPIDMDRIVTKKAVDYIAANRDRHFFLYVAYCLPHSPMEFQSETPPDAYLWETWPAEERAFASMVQMLDKNVGEIVNQVDRLGLGRKTIIVFTSDNGAHNEGGHNHTFFKSNGPFNGIKRDVIEGGIHTPMIIRWSGTIAQGTHNDLLSAFWDIMPTVCDLAGAPIPKQTDGISFAPTLKGKGVQAKHDCLYWEFSEHPTIATGVKPLMPFWPRQAVVFDHWKVIKYINEDKVELYDLSNDICEGNDLSALKPDLVKKGLALMDKAHVYNSNFPIFKSEGSESRMQPAGKSLPKEQAPQNNPRK